MTATIWMMALALAPAEAASPGAVTPAEMEIMLDRRVPEATVAKTLDAHTYSEADVAEMAALGLSKALQDAARGTRATRLRQALDGSLTASETAVEVQRDAEGRAMLLVDLNRDAAPELALGKRLWAVADGVPVDDPVLEDRHAPLAATLQGKGFEARFEDDGSFRYATWTVSVGDRSWTWNPTSGELAAVE